MLFLVPLVMLVIGAVAFRHLRVERRAALSLGLAVVVAVAATALFMVVGLYFHLAIGGQL